MTRDELIELLGIEKVKDLEKYLFLHAIDRYPYEMSERYKESKGYVWYEFNKVFGEYAKEKNLGGKAWDDEYDETIYNLDLPWSYPTMNIKFTDENIDDYEIRYLMGKTVKDAISDMLDDCHN